LWAFIGVKNPDYLDTLYITELVVSGVVNTMPQATMEAFADHGEVLGDRVTGADQDAQRVFDALAAVGVDIPDVFATLEREGVEKFAASWDELAATVGEELAGAK
jgi:transaldolase